jgi:CRISPR/Cas system-associated protein Cas10 (large subunit of type III CRISPR-Cas system)
LKTTAYKEKTAINRPAPGLNFSVYSVCFVLYEFPMKSAYELAMERLAKTDPAAAPLNAEQKARLAEIDRVYQGKLAEREIFLKQQLNAALAAQKLDEADQVRKQIAGEKARLEEEREDEKERARRAKR